MWMLPIVLKLLKIFIFKIQNIDIAVGKQFDLLLSLNLLEHISKVLTQYSQSFPQHTHLYSAPYRWYDVVSTDRAYANTSCF